MFDMRVIPKPGHVRVSGIVQAQSGIPLHNYSEWPVTRCPDRRDCFGHTVQQRCQGLLHTRPVAGQRGRSVPALGLAWPALPAPACPTRHACASGTSRRAPPRKDPRAIGPVSDRNPFRGNLRFAMADLPGANPGCDIATLATPVPTTEVRDVSNTLSLPANPDEQLVILSRMGRTYPFPGGTVAPSTIRRWALRGVRGVRLRTYPRGGRRYTSARDVREFLDALGNDMVEPRHEPEPAPAGAA